MKKTKGFTLLEVIIVILLLSIGLFSINKTITHAKFTNERVLQTIIWNQLATEWAEIVYQTRNTNLLKYDNNKERYVNNCINIGFGGNIMSWYDTCLSKFKQEKKINKCRLALDYQNCISKTNYTWIFNTWFYYISTDNWINTISKCEWDNCDDPYNEKYAICLNSGARTPCNEWHENWWDESHYWKFFRYIEWKWVYNMASDTTWWDLLSISQLSWTTAQEYRFCSYVTRIWWQGWSVEICSTMTNFID